MSLISNLMKIERVDTLFICSWSYFLWYFV